MTTINQRLAQITKEIASLDSRRTTLLSEQEGIEIASSILVQSNISLTPSRSTSSTKRVTKTSNSKATNRTMNQNTMRSTAKGFKIINLNSVPNKNRNYFQGQTFRTFVNDVIVVLEANGGQADVKTIATFLMKQYPGRWQAVTSVRSGLYNASHFTNAIKSTGRGMLALSGHASVAR